MSRKIIPFAVGLIMSCLVMVVAGVFSFAVPVSADKFSADTAWSTDYYNAESMNVIDLTGDGQDELFVQNPGNLTIYDGAGAILISQNYPEGEVKTTMTDVNNDGVEDVVAYYLSADAGMAVDVFYNLQSTRLAGGLNVSSPSRVVGINYASGKQIVLGDIFGRLLAVDTNGNLIWEANLFSNDEIRGLDDARIDGQIYLAAASYDGSLAVFDAQGQAVWETTQETLRRMRAFDLNGDGTSEIITGGEQGALIVYNAKDGTVLFNKTLGQAVSEVREVELNGDPSSREFVVGGKDGGVWAFSFDGNTASQLWTGSLSDKVTEISGIDIDDDGKEEAVLGDESGKVAVFTSTGSRNNLPDRPTGIMRIDVGKLNGQKYVLIADTQKIEVNQINFTSIPGFRYSPLIVGLIVSAVILIIAAILASIPAKPELKVSFQDKSRESLESERRMLKESIADVERLRKAGEVTGDAYLSRLKRLRGDLAENEAAFKTAGFPVKVETIPCPNCGGTLELGMDKCEYCGQVILS